MTLRIVFLLALSVVSGCATTANNKVWYKPSASQEQASADWRQCDYESSAGSYTPMGAFDSPISAGIQEGIQKVTLMSKCMQAKGYYLTDKASIAERTPKPHLTTSLFEEQEVAWFEIEGDGVIEGSALYRKNDGAIVSCAGQSVSLFPKSSYAAERLNFLYGSLSGGTNDVLNYRTADTPDPRYLRTTKEAFCDLSGEFRFEKLPDGEYFVIAKVFWGNPIQGGANIMRPVVLKGEPRVKLMLSN
jgi:hypothetical protein